MSKNKHTNEPWPHFTDIATTMTPDPEGTPVAILSWDDYIRARACVNACAGIDTDQLETGSINKSLQMFALESATYRRQRDELLSDIAEESAERDALNTIAKRQSAILTRTGDELADCRTEIAALKAECEFQRNAHKQAEELMLEQSKQLAASQEENAHWQKATAENENKWIDACDQLAAEQLNNKRLREALEAVIKVHGYESGIPVEAISTPANTEALDAYVKQKIKEYY